MPPPHWTSSWSTSIPSEETKSFLSARARSDASGDLDVGVAERLLDPEAKRDLLVERNGEGVPLPTGVRYEPERASIGAERTRPGAAGRRGEPAGAPRSVARSLGREPAVGGEPPGAADEHPNADPLAFAIGQRLDPSVLRPDRLRAPDGRPRIGVARAGPEGGVDGGYTRIAHLRRTLPAATMPSARWWRNW